MDKRDIALQATLPLLTTPLYGQLERLEGVGDRLVLAKNGLFVEVARKWGYFVRRVAPPACIAVPYGDMKETSQLDLPNLPNALLLQFNQHAAENCDVEVGASIVWNDRSGQFRLAYSKAIESTGSFLKQQLAPLDEGDHLIVDCHSHALHPAFFSSTDDHDDRHCTKFSYVVGNCDRPQQSTALRLCVRGIFEVLDASKLFATSN